jgi:hypothetical protein
MKNPTYLYHASHAPSGKLFPDLTPDLAAALAADGWADAPVKDATDSSDKASNGTDQGENIVSRVDFEGLTDQGMIAIIDDMGRKEVLAELFVRGIIPETDMPAHQLRRKLFETVNPDAIPDTSHGGAAPDEDEPLPTTADDPAHGAHLKPDPLGLMEAGPRAKAIGGMKRPQVEDELASRQIAIPEGANLPELRELLVNYFKN